MIRVYDGLAETSRLRRAAGRVYHSPLPRGDREVERVRQCRQRPDTAPASPCPAGSLEDRTFVRLQLARPTIPGEGSRARGMMRVRFVCVLCAITKHKSLNNNIT